MGIIFAVNGSNYTAKYSNGGATGALINSAKISQSAGGLAGQVFTMTDATQVKGIMYSGQLNVPNGKAISVLCRFKPAYTGAPAASRGIWSLSGGFGTTALYTELRHDITTGNITGIGKNELSSNTLAASSFGAWSPTSGTSYDVVFCWTGTTAANGAQVYVDGSSLGTATASAALSASMDNTWYKSIALGFNLNATTSALSVEEFVIWDTIIDPTAVALADGTTGSLNGASRTALVAYSSYDGRLQGQNFKTVIGKRY